jgi:hypothetical protein
VVERLTFGKTAEPDAVNLPAISPFGTPTDIGLPVKGDLTRRSSAGHLIGKPSPTMPKL